MTKSLLYREFTDLTVSSKTPTERSILSRLPPGTLELLAMTGCDDGALEDVSILEDPKYPGKVGISKMRRNTALESMGWAGFDSSQL